MDGIIIVNKPKACTSHDVVYKIRKMTGGIIVKIARILNKRRRNKK